METIVHDDTHTSASAAPAESSVVELRQYTLHPGRRDTLIELFEREFVESQEACGMRLFGQFRDLDHPDRFVWLRGFADMPARAQALGAFYGGSVWKAHRNAANATMLDSDNVLLLRPASVVSGFACVDGTRARVGEAAPAAGLVVATICHLQAPADRGFIDFFEQAVTPAQVAAGAVLLASFVSEHSANTFPALPVRDGENVLVSFAAFANPECHERHLDLLDRLPRWRDGIAAEWRSRLVSDPETLRLAPTARSRLRG